MFFVANLAPSMERWGATGTTDKFGGTMKFRYLLAALALALSVSEVNASTITVEMKDFQSVSLDGLSPKLLSYDEFDPDKGTLTRVDVDFFYSLQINVATAPQYVASTPIPYSGLLLAETSFQSLNRGFSSSVSSFQTLPVTATGTGEGALAFSFLSYGFSFEPTDPIIPDTPQLIDPDGSGGATAFLIEGSADDFLPMNEFIRGVPIYTWMETSVTSFDPRFVPLTTSINGSMLVTYTYLKEFNIPDEDDPETPPGYEPPVDVPPGVIPLPAGGLLLLGGLGALAGLRRRSKK
ncbi:VPLPA-CTERM sorting domain-containing protein [Lutimaribacter saemankumensis]|uniref:VPLPA-CTERM sorting domain-containing protein n=1 Tax=Lutimaribacter saemankumensis TaxID=490829 RepID=UPI001FDFB746|nr:VPLPA-CTERM sorting domain-containing protein [Lutimaribacter saemankumensis]